MITSQCAAGIVVWNNRIAVVHQNGNSWSLPKGHRDADESLLDTARREIGEETGVTDLMLVRKLGTYNRYKIARDGGDDTSELKEITVFLFRAQSAVMGSTEIGRSHPVWVPFDTACQLLTNSTDRDFLIANQRPVRDSLSEPLCQVVSTFASQDVATATATRLVKEKKAACVQVDGPITSIYEWHNRIETATEYRITIKCTRRCVEEIITMINEINPYETPEIIATDIVGGELNYLKWVSRHG